MTTMTKTGEYLKNMARDGHSRQKLGEAALSLTECYCKADTHTQANMGNHLAIQMKHILHVVYGWKEGDAHDAAYALRNAFADTATAKRVIENTATDEGASS